MVEMIDTTGGAELKNRSDDSSDEQQQASDGQNFSDTEEDQTQKQCQAASQFVDIETLENGVQQLAGTEEEKKEEKEEFEITSNLSEEQIDEKRLRRQDPDQSYKQHQKGDPYKFDKLFFMKVGVNNVCMFNIISGKSIKFKIKMPQVFPSLHQFTVMPLNYRLFVTGGRDETKSRHCYELECKEREQGDSTSPPAYFIATEKSQMHSPHEFHSACFLDDRYFIVSGSCTSDHDGKVVEKYDIQEDTWEQLPSMNVPRFMHGSCGFRQTMVFIFGGWVNKQITTSIIRMDLSQGQREWEDIQIDWPTSMRTSIGCVQFSRDEILLIGGFNGNNAMRDIWIFNVDENTCREKPFQVELNLEFWYRKPALSCYGEVVFGVDCDTKVRVISEGSPGNYQVDDDYMKFGKEPKENV